MRVSDMRELMEILSLSEQEVQVTQEAVSKNYFKHKVWIPTFDSIFRLRVLISL